MDFPCKLIHFSGQWKAWKLPLKKSLSITETKTCSPDAFQCPGSHMCIPKHWKCDRDKDCTDGADESVKAGCGEWGSAGRGRIWSKWIYIHLKKARETKEDMSIHAATIGAWNLNLIYSPKCFVCLSVQQHLQQQRVHVPEPTVYTQALCVWPWQRLQRRLGWVPGMWWVDPDETI